MKVSIYANAEGLKQAVSGSQTLSDERDCQVFRGIRTKQVKAVVDDFIEGVIREMYTDNAHGFGKNIFYKSLYKKAKMIIGDQKTNSTMQGIEFTDRAFLLSYHFGSGTGKGVLNHTRSLNVPRLSVNDGTRKMGLSLPTARKFVKSVEFFMRYVAALNLDKKYTNGARLIVIDEGISRISTINYSLNQPKDNSIEAG